MDRLIRTEILIGKNNINKLLNSKVIVFGIGGVGSYCIEALARTGIMELHIVDDDAVSISNLNRQVIATSLSIGKDKTELMKRRILDIDKDIKVQTSKIFYTKKTAHLIDLSKYDYVVDAVDSIASKVLIAEEAKKACVPVISSMGTGNKMDPSMFMIDDIYSTSVCPVARIMRNELRKKGIENLAVVYSKEKPKKPSLACADNKKSPGSMSFVPPVCGFLMASYVVKNIIK